MQFPGVFAMFLGKYPQKRDVFTQEFTQKKPQALVCELPVMPRKCLMSWEGPPACRWIKMYKGRRYRVSCDDLHTPKTKDGSYQAANNWWLVKRAELATATVELEQQELLDTLKLKMDYAANKSPGLLQNLQMTKDTVLAEVPGEIVIDDAEAVAENLKIAELLGVTVPPDLDPAFMQHLFGDRRLWQERLSKHQLTETEKTLGHQLDKFLEELRTQQAPKTHIEIRHYLRGLLGTEVWAAQTNIETIDEKTVTRHYAHLIAMDLAPVSHNKYLGFFRRFVNWMYASAAIPREPLNLKFKSHRKAKVHKAIKRYDNVPAIVQSLPEDFRLWALLGLNCGMTNRDFGSITWDADIDGFPQIDQERWILTRRRGKTGHLPQSPTVRYKLWPETIEALERLPTRTGLLFTSKSGGPMYRTFYRENGTPGKMDLFADRWNDLKTKPPITLGKFRSVGATALNTDKLFRSYKEYFLANAPGGTTNQHYAAEDDKPFFEALEHIRTTLGFGTEPIVPVERPPA